GGAGAGHDGGSRAGGRRRRGDGRRRCAAAAQRDSARQHRGKQALPAEHGPGAIFQPDINNFKKCSSHLYMRTATFAAPMGNVRLAVSPKATQSVSIDAFVRASMKIRNLDLTENAINAEHQALGLPPIEDDVAHPSSHPVLRIAVFAVVFLLIATLAYLAARLFNGQHSATGMELIVAAVTGDAFWKAVAVGLLAQVVD